MSVIQHKKGAPSRAERIQIRKDLEPYFEQNIPAYKAAKITGYNVKTINKYYEQFWREIHGHVEKNFVQRYGKAMMHVAMTFENLIRRSYDVLEDVESEIKKSKDEGGEIPPHLIQNHSKIIRDIAHLAEKKASLMMLPDAGNMIDEEIKKRADRNA